MEITELIARQRFRIREVVPFSTRAVGALFLLAGIAFLIVPITQVPLIEEFFKEKLGSVPAMIPELVRILLIVTVAILSFQLLRQLFGTTEVEGTINAITRRHRLLGIPLTRAMNKSDFRFVEVKHRRGRANSSSDVENRFVGSWEVGMVGTGGLLKFCKTESLEEAKWLSRFVADWYGLKVELKGDDRRIGF
ncbi:hypothetical protein HZ994_03790 [Akkermansiaceae bacterium]|nr:hypothetical protein HZ994_03790 [Akkermansiaceae bacterium]